jgi:PAS domain S-box-containing protein
MAIFGKRKEAEAAGSKPEQGVVALVQADAEGKIRLWSEGAEALLGYSAAEAVGQTLDLIVPPNYREAHWGGFRRAMEQKGVAGNEPFVLPIRCGGGRVKHFAGRLMYLGDAYGNAVGALALFVPEKTGPGAPELYRLE